ncbi:DUF294 nucleotidyltransferase-like domain-containing protein [Azospirillum sp. ST 5-10]|uniref:DUF294 nucleotidyltransferase-like domain-containing protein n=1 Tax=unclassified Azospirillum TaxID=2630922 RepID=UPI003F49D6C7
MDPALLSRLDTWPYRHRLAEVMTAPVATAPPGLSLGEAAERMERRGISSLLVEGDGPAGVAGIVTERDVLRALVHHGAAALSLPLAAAMSAPVEAVPADCFVYVALGRLDRLDIRHLAVTDGAGRVCGIVTARSLLRQRAGRALALGDQAAAALDAAAMGAVRAALPALARSLLAEGLAAPDVAAVLSEVLRDLAGRAAELAAAELAAGPAGPAPAPWCLMVLGSAGRGEALLAADQDTALVHAGTADADPWFAALGRRASELLDAAGVPLCRGGVMASNAAWRHDRAGWVSAVERWVAAARPEDLLQVDVFFDLHAVAGEPALAEELRARALELAARSTAFLKALGEQLQTARPPTDVLGRLRTVEDRVDLKLGGLWPAVAAARVLALRHGLPVTGTRARLAALAGAGHLNEADAAALADLHALCLGLLLDQQLADRAAGIEPSSRVDVRRLDRATVRRLRHALACVWRVPDMVRDGLSVAA